LSTSLPRRCGSSCALHASLPPGSRQRLRFVGRRQRSAGGRRSQTVTKIRPATAQATAIVVLLSFASPRSTRISRNFTRLGGGLVENQDPSIERKRAGDLDPLRLRHREISRPATRPCAANVALQEFARAAMEPPVVDHSEPVCRLTTSPERSAEAHVRWHQHGHRVRQDLNPDHGRVCWRFRERIVHVQGAPRRPRASVDGPSRRFTALYWVSLGAPRDRL
jgi:hypothetical protein